MKPNKSVAVILLALASTVSMQGAVSLVSITSLKANGNTGSGNGNLNQLSEFTGGAVGGTGTDTGIVKVDANDPATWTHGSNWQQGWQTGKTSGTNIGWVVMDFGTSQTQLGTMYLWNVTEAGTAPQSRGVNTFNIWYTETPTTTVPGSGSYNFSTSGWTQLGSTKSLAIGGTTGALTGSFDISGIASARHVAIEILTNHGSSTSGVDTANRVGLAEIVITQVPEPSGALLLGSSCLALLFRRRVA